MDATEGCGEVLDHAFEPRRQGRAPSDHHVIMPGQNTTLRRLSYEGTQPAPHAIALDGGSDLTRHRESHARRRFIAPWARLQHEGGGGCLRAARGGDKVGASPQPVHAELVWRRVRR